jgi:hypothetical protein
MFLTCRFKADTKIDGEKAFLNYYFAPADHGGRGRVVYL